LKGDDTILHLKLFHPDQQMAKGITLHRFDDDYQITERIDADEGTFQDGAWVLRRGIIQRQGSSSTCNV
jgi:lipopolysaccharide export LptBFGC system permease protein LptF